jgi:hypothetical protein
MIGRFERRRFLAVASGTIGLLAGCTGGNDSETVPETGTTWTDDGETPKGDESTASGDGETTAGSDETSTTDSDEASTGESSSGSDTDTRSKETADGRTTQTGNVATATDGGTAENDDLDLREANVVDVTVDRDGRSFGFDVTLYHDDDGEDGYANWWQVETLDGDRLGRRELLHAHSTAPFTRSATIEIPEGVTCVIVRGHDQKHGYGGQAALVNLDSGEARFVRQGPTKRSFDASECP